MIQNSVEDGAEERSAGQFLGSYTSLLQDEGSEIDYEVGPCYDATDFLPLGAERGYDANTDTLTLGHKPDANYRVVENGDFAGYWQECDGGRYWDVVAVDLRRASVHLAPALAALPQPAPVSGG